MTEPQKVIQEALARYRKIQWIRGGLACFGALVLGMALTALLDRLWMFEGVARYSGWTIGLVLAAWATRSVVGPARVTASTLAHWIEAEAKEDAPVVATAIDPAVRETADRETVARTLLNRLDLKANEAIRTAPPVFRDMLRAPLALAAVVVVTLVALVALHGEQGLRRMLCPWQKSSYTSLSLAGPKEPVAEGTAFALTAQLSGVPVEKITLYRHGSTIPVAEGVPDEQGRVCLALESLDDPAVFVARAGDGMSQPLRVAPYFLPHIETFEIAVTPPSYSSKNVSTKAVPSFSAFRGSRLRYRIRLKAPAVSIAFERNAVAQKEERATAEELAQLDRTGLYRGMPLRDPEATDTTDPAVPVFYRDPKDPLVWEATWNLPDPEDIVYRLAITGSRGDLVRNDEPWRITVLSDGTPNVQIVSHDGADVIKTGKETVRFELSAVDDVRLAKVRLVFRKPGRPHTRREIDLPEETSRTWSGTELLDLAPFDLRFFDIVAVHAEAEDANLVDGPSIGRSEVVFLEVPLPMADEAGAGGGAGQEIGGGTPPINPLEIQMEILRSTIMMPNDAPPKEREAIAHDQRQNAEYTGMMERAAAAMGATDLEAALGRARAAMESATELLDSPPPSKAIPDEETALGALVDAAKLVEGDEGSPEPGSPEMAAEGLRFQLRPAQRRSSLAQTTKEDVEKEREDLRKLVEEVRRQLAEQKKLNQEDAGDGGERAEYQHSLAEDARSAANQARGMPNSSSRRGDPRAAAEDLELAARLQDSTADALSGGDSEASAQLGAESAEVLAEALQELATQLETNDYDGEARPVGYERLISDYLRAISYE